MKYTAETLAKMSALFSATGKTDEGLKTVLLDEAQSAGVFNSATTTGLSLEQWEMVRNPWRTLRNAILVAGE